MEQFEGDTKVKRLATIVIGVNVAAAAATSAAAQTAERVRQEAGFAVAFGFDAEIDAMFVRAREALGETDYAAAMAEGRALTLDAALAEAEATAAAAIARYDEANRTVA